jgi:hypothetical protein
MTKKDLSIITDVAYRVRYFGELFQQGHCREFHPDLTGMCGICAYFLFRALKKKNLHPAFSSNHCHSFVIIKGFVVDVTATQFDKITNKIFIKPMPFFGWRKHWTVNHQATQSKDIPCLFDDWITSQNPFHYSTKEERNDLLTLWNYVAMEDIKKVKEKVGKPFSIFLSMTVSDSV